LGILVQFRRLSIFLLRQRPVRGGWRCCYLCISWSAYLSLLLLIKSYAELFLPRTPMAVDKKILNVGVLGVGLGVIGLMVDTVAQVKKV